MSKLHTGAISQRVASHAGEPRPCPIPDGLRLTPSLSPYNSHSRTQAFATTSAASLLHGDRTSTCLPCCRSESAHVLPGVYLRQQTARWPGSARHCPGCSRLPPHSSPLCTSRARLPQLAHETGTGAHCQLRGFSAQGTFIHRPAALMTSAPA